MRNLKTIFTMLLGFILCVSCIKEDMSDCPQNNLTLNLHYLGDTQDPTMFARMIEGVTLFVFDAGGQIVLNRTLTQAEITAQSVDLMLPSGQKYKIICWANASTNTIITQGTKLNDFHVNHPNYGSVGAVIPTNDHLYMGYIDVTPPVSGIVSGDIYFKGAHNNIEIYVDNFGKKDDLSTYPIIEISNLMPQYDLEMNALQSADETYFPTVTFDAKHNMLASKFQTLQFDDDNPVIITIKDPITGNILYKLNLKEYMLDNSISVDGLNERTIIIQFKFTDLGVLVTLPEWAIIGIRP